MNERQIFVTALTKSSADEQRAYLDEACDRYGVPRSQVEALLREHDHLGDFLETPAHVRLASADLGEERVPGQFQRPSGSDRSEARVLGDFRILREIGQGGMGVVYEAEQISLRRRVALKTFPFAAILDDRGLRRFKNEAVAAASLKHPNIVTIFSVGCDRGVHYYAMDYIEGQTLARVIEELKGLPRSGEGPGVPIEAGGAVPGGLAEAEAEVQPGAIHLPIGADTVENAVPSPLSASPAADTRSGSPGAASTWISHQPAEFFHAAARLGIQAAEALDHAHRLGVVHRDIKPSNIMVDAQGHLWVTDFGLAMVDAESASTLTRSGDLMGTLRYMSPEQVEGNWRVLDHRTDVFSLGATLYELLTLQPAVAATDRHTAIHEIVDRDPPPPRRINGAVPKDLETIVLKALAKDPRNRYTTAQDMADDLRRFLDDQPIRAHRPRIAERLSRWSRRHRALVWSAAISMIVMLAGLLASTALALRAYQSEKQQRDIAAENAARAQTNYEVARKAVKQMLTRVADEEVAQFPEMKEVRQGLLEDAAAFYTELLELNPGDAVVFCERGHVYSCLQQYGKAGADFRKAVELEPDDPALQFALAWHLYHCPDVAYRDQRRALEHAKRAVALDPQKSLYHVVLTYIYLALRCRDQAVAEIQEVVRLDPGSAATYAALGEVYRLLGDRQTALENLKKAVELAPRSPFIDYSLAQVFATLHQEESALAALDRAIEVNPNPNGNQTFYFYSLRGDINWALGRQAAALADFSKSIELAPFRSYVYKRRAVVYFQMKDYDRALADIAKAVELNPGDASNLTWIPPAEVAKCESEALRAGLLELADKTVELTDGSEQAQAARKLLRDAFGLPEAASKQDTQAERKD